MDSITTTTSTSTKSLVIEPINGLANRLRAMASAWILSKSLKRSFYVNWKSTTLSSDKHYVPAFEEIYIPDCLPLVNVELQYENDLSDSVYDHSNLQKDCKDCKDCKSYTVYEGGHLGEQRLLPEIKRDTNTTVILRAGGVFKPDNISVQQYNTMKSEFYNRLELQPNIQDIIDSFIVKNFPSSVKVLGVHIRRGDRRMYTGASNKFVEAIKRIQTKYGVLFLCTDSKDEEIYIKKQITGISIVSYQKESIGRTNLTEFIDAVVDWNILSKTDLILYSKGSSFGYEACFPRKLKGSIQVGGKDTTFYPLQFE
jgi:hypothetical protein